MAAGGEKRRRKKAKFHRNKFEVGSDAGQWLIEISNVVCSAAEIWLALWMSSLESFTTLNKPESVSRDL